MLVTCNAEVRREWGLPSSKIKRHHPTILIAMPNPQEQEKEIIFCHHSSFFVAIADPPAPFFTFVSDSVFFFFFTVEFRLLGNFTLPVITYQLQFKYLMSAYCDLVNGWFVTKTLCTVGKYHSDVIFWVCLSIWLPYFLVYKSHPLWMVAFLKNSTNKITSFYRVSATHSYASSAHIIFPHAIASPSMHKQAPLLFFIGDHQGSNYLFLLSMALLYCRKFHQKTNPLQG